MKHMSKKRIACSAAVVAALALTAAILRCRDRVNKKRSLRFSHAAL